MIVIIPGRCLSILCVFDKSVINEAEAHLERLQHISWIKGEADALPCHFHISECL